MNKIKIIQPMWKTSEFWAALVGNLIGLAVVLGTLTEAQGSEITEAVQTISGAVMAIASILGFITAQSKRKDIAARLIDTRAKGTAGDPLNSISKQSLDEDIQTLQHQI